MPVSTDFNAGSNWVDGSGVRQTGTVNGQALILDGTKMNGGVQPVLTGNATPNSMVMVEAAPAISLKGFKITCASSSTFSTGGFNTNGSGSSSIELDGSSDSWTGTFFKDSDTPTDHNSGSLVWKDSSITFGTSVGSTPLMTSLLIYSPDAVCTGSAGPNIGAGSVTIKSGGYLTCTPDSSYGQTWAADSTCGNLEVDGELEVKAGNLVTIPMPVTLPDNGVVRQDAESLFKCNGVTQTGGQWMMYVDSVSTATTLYTSTTDYVCSGGTFELRDTSSNSAIGRFKSNYNFTLSGGTLDVYSIGTGVLFDITSNTSGGGGFNMTSGYLYFGVSYVSGTVHQDMLSTSDLMSLAGTLCVEQVGGTPPSGTEIHDLVSGTVDAGFTGISGLTLVDGSSIYNFSCTWGYPGTADLWLQAK